MKITGRSEWKILHPKFEIIWAASMHAGIMSISLAYIWALIISDSQLLWHTRMSSKKPWYQEDQILRYRYIQESENYMYTQILTYLLKWLLVRVRSIGDCVFGLADRFGALRVRFRIGRHCCHSCLLGCSFVWGIEIQVGREDDKLFLCLCDVWWIWYKRVGVYGIDLHHHHLPGFQWRTQRYLPCFLLTLEKYTKYSVSKTRKVGAECLAGPGIKY